MEEDHATNEQPERQPAGSGYRVIGADGVERTIGAGRDWIDAFRSGLVTGESLVWDPELRRWIPVSTLDIHLDARTSSSSPTDAAASDRRADHLHGEAGGESRDEPLFRHAGTSRTLLTAAVCALGLALTWAALSGEAAQWLTLLGSLLAQVPWPIYVLIGLVIAEEFHWFTLGLLHASRSGFWRRFTVQALSLLSTVLALYGMSVAPGLVREAARLGRNIGVPTDPAVPERILTALLSGDARQAAHLAFVQHPFLTGGLFATAALFWGTLLLRKGPLGRRTAAALLAALMLAATLHMALAPTLEQGRPWRGARPAGAPASNSR